MSASCQDPAGTRIPAGAPIAAAAGHCGAPSPPPTRDDARPPSACAIRCGTLDTQRRAANEIGESVHAIVGNKLSAHRSCLA